MKMVQRLSVLLSFLWLAAVFFVSVSTQAQAATARIKDIVNIEGVRDNVLIGYGLVVGFERYGDKLNNPFHPTIPDCHAGTSGR